MSRIKTIPFEPEKFNLSDHNKKTIMIFKLDGYILQVASNGGLYGVKGKEFRLLDQVHPKSGFYNWFWNQFD